jgi:hypothetical protein
MTSDRENIALRDRQRHESEGATEQAQSRSTSRASIDLVGMCGGVRRLQHPGKRMHKALSQTRQGWQAKVMASIPTWFKR